MEEPMKKPKPPKTDSIHKLAEFWDSHDLTDFEDQLVDVKEPVFVRRTAIEVPLESKEVRTVERMTEAEGISREQLIRNWILQNLPRPKNGRAKRGSR
jgi:hypothetical protein